MSQPPAASRVSEPPTSPAAPVFDTMVIVGVGLIGGSIAAAARDAGVVRRIIGIGRAPEKLAPAVATGLIDSASADLAGAASGADLIVFCTPVDRIAEGVRLAGSACPTHTILTDAGSTKERICDDLAQQPPQRGEFLGGHPIAGSEKNGFEHARGDLFRNRPCITTPTATSSDRARTLLRQFWERLGSAVTEMSPQAHDLALAQISHAPHVIATALAKTLSPEYAALVGSGFRDTTRIAAGDADLWTSIVRSNRACLVASLEQFVQQLAAFQSALQNDDAAELRQFLQLGAERRAALDLNTSAPNTLAECESTPAPCHTHATSQPPV